MRNPPTQSSSAPDARVVHKGIRVTAVSKASGPPATSIHVELNARELRDELGDAQVQSVTARVPLADGKDIRWAEEPMRKVPGSEGSDTGIECFESTHYGPCEARELGVDVRVTTARGSVWSHGADESFPVRENDHPRHESTARPLPRRS